MCIIGLFAVRNLRPVDSMIPILAVRIESGQLHLGVALPTIDSDCALQLRTELVRAIEALPLEIKSVRLDVSQVLAMSSRGFEALIRLHTCCRDRGLHLTLSKLTPTFHRLLERMGFLRLFAVEQ